MNKQTGQSQYKVSASGQLVIVLSNTKYTYAHFTEFHETVLTILDNNDLSALSKIQMDHTVFFINMVLGLLDAPTKNISKENRKSNKQGEPIRKEALQDDQKGVSTIDYQKTAVAGDKENLKKLLKWIEEIVMLERITVEKMLDEFYRLGIVELKL